MPLVSRERTRQKLSRTFSAFLTGFVWYFSWLGKEKENEQTIHFWIFCAVQLIRHSVEAREEKCFAHTRTYTSCSWFNTNNPGTFQWSWQVVTSLLNLGGKKAWNDAGFRRKDRTKLSRTPFLTGFVWYFPGWATKGKTNKQPTSENLEKWEAREEKMFCTPIQTRTHTQHTFQQDPEC